LRFFKIRDKQEGKDIVHVWLDDDTYVHARVVKEKHGEMIKISSVGFMTDRYELIDKQFDEYHWCKGCHKRVYWKAGPIVGGNIFDGENYWHVTCFKGDTGAEVTDG
jgi:hypothetical protein